MAVSPLVMHPQDALQNQPNSGTRAVSSPLKNVSSTQGSASGTPQPNLVVPNAAAAVQSTSLDLAEQRNEDERRKYVKGKLHYTVE